MSSNRVPLSALSDTLFNVDLSAAKGYFPPPEECRRIPENSTDLRIFCPRLKEFFDVQATS